MTIFIHHASASAVEVIANHLWSLSIIETLDGWFVRYPEPTMLADGPSYDAKVEAAKMGLTLSH